MAPCFRTLAGAACLWSARFLRFSSSTFAPRWKNRPRGSLRAGRVSREAERHLGKDIVTYLGSFLFLVVLMFAFNSFSHGTQDLYPTFLQKNLLLSPKTVSLIAIVYNVGALLGGILFGTLSERIGRRRAIVIAAVLAIPIVPLWAYSHSVPVLALGGCL